jgi:hypothetical protein
MDKIMKGLIEEKLNVLIQQPLIDIGRASNLLWLSFGERVVTIDRKGNEIQKGKYALNVQCAWRLTQNSHIIVASKDFYLPKTGLEYDSFDWEEYGNNRFDERISSFKPMITTTNLSVSNISVDDIGGVKIDFEFGVKFELFPDDSLEEEFWRFIINGNKSEHFVFVEKEE